MGLLQFTVAVLALGNVALGSPVPEAEVAAASSKYCETASGICYSEWVSPEKIAYRFAIPDSATAGSFDILLQIVAPKAVGWAGLAWGGGMTNGPLAVAWANGNTAVISSRKAASKTYPAVSTDVTYTVLPSSNTNSTHWTLTALAKGASSFGTTKLDPTSSTVSFAYAQSATGPTDPTSPSSRFSIHQSKAKFTGDLASAKNANFAALVEKASKPASKM